MEWVLTYLNKAPITLVLSWNWCKMLLFTFVNETIDVICGYLHGLMK